MKDKVLNALQQQGWNPEAARQWMLNNGGDRTPDLEQFQQQCAVEAKARWRQIVKQKGVDHIATNEAEAHILMEMLDAYLSADDASDVIREEQDLQRVRNPKPFYGLQKKD